MSLFAPVFMKGTRLQSLSYDKKQIKALFANEFALDYFPVMIDVFIDTKQGYIYTGRYIDYGLD